MIQVEYRDPQSEDRSSRMLIAALLLSGMAGVALIGRAPLVLDWLLPLPYAVIALVGLIWWLLLSPSVVGLVILLLAAWGAVRRPAGSVR